MLFEDFERRIDLGESISKSFVISAPQLRCYIEYMFEYTDFSHWHRK
eukprot:UN09247